MDLALEDLFEDIESLKHSERQGWKDRDIDIPRDTIASHSFGTALLAWARAEELGFDSDKAVKTLLIQDLIMARVQDLTPHEEGYDSKKEMEEAKTEALMQNIPETMRGEFTALRRVPGAGHGVRQVLQGVRQARHSSTGALLLTQGQGRLRQRVPGFL